MGFVFRSRPAYAVDEGLLERWNALCDRVPDTAFYHRPAWVLAADRFRPEGRTLLHLAYAGDRLVAVAPSAAEVGSIHGLPCVLRVGPAQDPSQFTDVLVAPEHRTAEWARGWLDHVRRTGGPWDALRFRRVPPDGVLRTVLDRAGIRHAVRDPVPARVVDVREPGRLDRLSARQVDNVRRLARRAEREVGPLRRRTYAAPGTILEGFDLFVTLEASGWKGDWEHLSALAYRPPDRAFFTSVLQGLAATGEARVDVLYAGAEPLAAHVALRAGATWHLLKIGYDEAWRSVGPGGLLLWDFLEAMAREPGVERVGLVTAPAWSDRWHMDEVATGDVWIYGSSRRGRLLLAERAVQDSARRALHGGARRVAP